eukprot:TRINITY_DN2683_c1_g1_i1.p1 TRINITY_DN2683_c1_g1~~TRINITY_DN2683_c1_g1_i1.p1  ORF type:complete len:108 (+),score=10.54 TRINITY_DN2683_c1_g1_i1:31-354(+)
MTNYCSHGTLLHFSLQFSRLNICYCLFVDHFGEKRQIGKPGRRKKRNMPGKNEWKARYVQLSRDTSRIGLAKERRRVWMQRSGALFAPLEWFLKKDVEAARVAYMWR